MCKEVFFLFFEFLKVGLFTYGGGYASLPFLYQIAQVYDWFNIEELTRMIAIAGITPGPVGLNVATFAGFKAMGVFGAIIASFALILPMVIIASQVFRLYKKFSENKCVQNILYVLRPTSCALIASVGIKLFYELILNKNINFTEINQLGLFLILVLFVLTFKMKRDPIIYLTIASLFGIIVKICKLI